LSILELGAEGRSMPMFLESKKPAHKVRSLRRRILKFSVITILPVLGTAIAYPFYGVKR